MVIASRLVVVGHLYFIGIAALEAKTDPPLLVDEYGVLTLSVSVQGMQPVAGGDSEIIEPLCEVNIVEPSYCPWDDVRRQPPGLAREE
ncbi:MAG: hypothetical protein WBN38_12160 [Polyangiales bacterium]|jgi:hypothetical protein